MEREITTMGAFLRDWLPIIQTGVIVLLGFIGKKTLELTDRLARIEEQVDEQKDKLRVIDERCFTALRQVHGIGGHRSDAG